MYAWSFYLVHFGLYFSFQDPQTAEIIRELEHRKKEAIKGVRNFDLIIQGHNLSRRLGVEQ